MKQAPSAAWFSWLQRLRWVRQPALISDDPASMGTAFGLEMSLLPEAPASSFGETGTRISRPLARAFSRRHR